MRYLLPTGQVIVTMDDGGQERVDMGELVDPVISVGSREWPAGDVRPYHN